MSDDTSHQALWPQMIAALAAIDAELGIPDDGCNTTAGTLAAIRKLKAEANKSERRAVVFGDILHNHIITMRASLVDKVLQGDSAGWNWIINTLEGPGHLPDLDEARALGGAQALWDKETAEHEAFRKAHPGPVVEGEGR